MTPGIAKRSVTIAGHRTSVSLEEPFWTALAEIAAARGVSLGALVAEIDAGRAGANLSSALRLHVLAVLRARIEAQPPGPGAAGAGSGIGGGTAGAAGASRSR